jgi:hypothetical protein
MQSWENIVDLPHGCAPDAIISSLASARHGIPLLVASFTTCLGISRHAENDSNFVSTALDNVGARHVCLLDLIEGIANENPFSTF